MKMSVKLIILFSVLAAAVTLTFSVISYQTNLNNLYDNTHVSLDTMAQLMQTEIESYLQMQSYAMEELTTSPEFMDAFYTVYNSSDSDYSPEIAAAQTKMSQIMYQAPLVSAFTRVSVYNRDGFFLTSQFEKTNAIVSFSDEARETIDSLTYLDQLDSSPYIPLVLSVHPDPWSAHGNVLVFSLVKAAMYHGELIGYLEVSAPLDDLANIFLTRDEEGISTQAIFEDGRELFLSWHNDYDYGDIAEGEMLYYPIDGASDRLVVRQHSKELHLNIFVAQEIDALGSSRAAIFKRSLQVMLPILLVTILMVVLISLGLTSSIRKLRMKISDLPADNFLNQSDLSGPTHVVKPWDTEMYELEQSFNDLLTTLRISHENEVSLREGTLKAQLNALQLQINPHFVYNTLNIISAKGLESGSEEITEICDQFAQMLRYSTDIRSKTASLKEELDNVRHYLFLCKMRYEDRLEFKIDVPESMMDIVLPRLTLQPLVENAMKYGDKGAEFQQLITIHGLFDDSSFALYIQDNGNGFDWNTLSDLRRSFRLIDKNEPPADLASDNHLGLINTYQRIHYYSHGSLRMELYNDNGAIVKLTNASSDNPSADLLPDSLPFQPRS